MEFLRPRAAGVGWSLNSINSDPNPTEGLGTCFNSKIFKVLICSNTFWVPDAHGLSHERFHLEIVSYAHPSYLGLSVNNSAKFTIIFRLWIVFTAPVLHPKLLEEMQILRAKPDCSCHPPLMAVLHTNHAAVSDQQRRSSGWRGKHSDFGEWHLAAASSLGSMNGLSSGCKDRPFVIPSHCKAVFWESFECLLRLLLVFFPLVLALRCLSFFTSLLLTLPLPLPLPLSLSLPLPLPLLLLLLFLLLLLLILLLLRLLFLLLHCLLLLLHCLLLLLYLLLLLLFAFI